MPIGLRLDLRQTQQLVMTPQLQQAIKLLAMSNIELQDFVSEAIEQNPLLQIANPENQLEESTAETAAPERVSAADERTEDHSLSADVFDNGTENLNETGPSDGPHGSEERSHRVNGSGTPAVAERLSALEERIAERPGLREHLREQLGRMSIECPLTHMMARYLVEELDEHGFLRADLSEISDRLNVDPSIVVAALKCVQCCDPTGVGARNLPECLALQLREEDDVEPAMEVLLENLELLGRGELKKLRSLCAVDANGLSDLVAQLRLLNPRPCVSFDPTEPPTLVPDIIVKRSNWGGWDIELNSETLPKVIIDRTYKARVGGEQCDETRHFLADCQANATWVLKSLDQRANTILKVASEIVRQQERFFSDGISGLRPLTLRDIADVVGVHESTISRVTTNKFIATDFGIFELKFFFTNAVGGEDSDIAAETVRRRIKTLVDAEGASSILSDDAIVAKLRVEGVDVARRTVAKYRKSLKIPSSVERRRLHALSAGI